MLRIRWIEYGTNDEVSGKMKKKKISTLTIKMTVEISRANYVTISLANTEE